MSVRMVRLGDVCARISDGTHQAPNWADNGIPFLFVSNIRNGRISFETNRFVSSAEYTKLTKNCPIEAGDVLYTAVGSYGNSAVVPSGKTFIFQRHVAHLKPQHELIDSSYLAQMLETPAVRRQADKLARGVAQKTVTLTSLRNFEIPLPALEEQKRIAAILDKAVALRAKRRQAIALLDSLTQSIFLEMFGDPVSNPRGWPLRTMSQLTTSRLGKMLDQKKMQGLTVYPYLANLNVQWNRLILTDLREMGFSEEERQEFALNDGDLLICEGGEIGRCAIWRNELPNCYYQKALHRVRCKTDLCTPEYLLWYFWFKARNGGLQFHTSVATIAHLTGAKLKSLPVPTPPIEMQRKFSSISRMLDARVAKGTTAIQVADHLFASLQHRAFTGQL